MRFRAELESTGTNTAGFEVPEAVVDGLDGGRRPKVAVTVNGYPFRTSIARMEGRFLLGMSAAPREVEVPDDLAVALDGDHAARGFWQTLSYSKQQWHVLQVTGAKKAETRAARVAKSVAMLREGRAR